MKLVKPKNAIYHLHSNIEQIDLKNLEPLKVHYFANVQPYDTEPPLTRPPEETFAEYIDQYYERQSERYVSHYPFDFPFGIGPLRHADRDKLYEAGINLFTRLPGIGIVLHGWQIAGTQAHLQEVLLVGTFLREFRNSLSYNQPLYDLLFRAVGDTMQGEYALEHFANRILHDFNARRWMPYGQKGQVGFSDQPKIGRGIFFMTRNLHVHLIWDWRKKTFFVHSFGNTLALLQNIVTLDQIGECEVIMGDPVAKAMELTEKFGPEIVVLPHHVGGYNKLIVDFQFVKEKPNEQAL